MMDILWLFAKIIVAFLTSHWLVVVTFFIGLCCMLVIALSVFHPDNKKVYDSHANIALKDLLEGEKTQH
ncbi:hypothetical protein [uncultured Methylophaga sp.]|uniref:hypothetical protein n=1 Tax=uncultured Methylophaga sp. TaxID=285271 RepID=UPI0030DD1E03|tara:strand:- start:8127 stop:8333 length:207 start_codon:yes stop_codon:yes gene_type:complete